VTTLIVAPRVPAQEAPDLPPPATRFDPRPWLEDLDQVQETLATKYANLEWVVTHRHVDLAALLATARVDLEHASTEAEAKAAFNTLARAFDDGHVVIAWPTGSPARSAGPDSGTCAALGYDARMRADPIALEAPGVCRLKTRSSTVFPIGVMTVRGTRVGILQIPLFSPEGFPALCETALAERHSVARDPCDETCADDVERRASDLLTQALAAQIRALKRAGAAVLLIDIAGNGGGSEWAEAAARMLTARRIESEDLRFVRGEHWATAFASDEQVFREGAATESVEFSTLLVALADRAAAMRRAATEPCDSTPLWTRETLPCPWLGTGLYSSGYLRSAYPATLKGKRWAARVFKPARFTYQEGIWGGPLLVLTDRGTGSAAARFAALLQDNHAAVLIGEPAAGGCGYTNGGTPTRLRNSGATLRVPDCATFRTDGRNELDGVKPDVPIDPDSASDPRQRAIRVLERLPDALHQSSRR
jgi:hypothetical protein